MRAIVYHRYGGPDVLKIEDVKRPIATKGSVVVRIMASAVNPADWQIRSGKRIQLSSPFTFIPGIDMAGIVEDTGPEVSEFISGDRVFGLVPLDLQKEGRGSYAEYVEVPVRRMAKMSPKMSFEHAAAIPVSIQTVWKSLFELGGLSSEDTVLIHAAAGGVGHIAVQMAKWKGAKVAGTASGRNQEFLREIGVDMPINYETMVFEDAVRDVDIVLDTIVRDADSCIDIDAQDTRERSWHVLKKGGILVSLTGDPDFEKAEKYGVRAARLMAENVISGDCSNVLNMAVELYESNNLKPNIFRVFSLDQAQEAHRLSQQGHTRGKIIIKVGNHTV